MPTRNLQILSQNLEWKCESCKDQTPNRAIIQCDVCDIWYHISCVDLPEEILRLLASEENVHDDIDVDFIRHKHGDEYEV
jgi:hypothetical protein